jgi:hypothetical protein
VLHQAATKIVAQAVHRRVVRKAQHPKKQALRQLVKKTANV